MKREEAGYVCACSDRSPQPLAVEEGGAESGRVAWQHHRWLGSSGFLLRLSRSAVNRHCAGRLAPPSMRSATYGVLLSLMRVNAKPLGRSSATC